MRNCWSSKDAQRSAGYQLGRADLSGVREEPARFDRSDESAFVERPARRLLAARAPGWQRLPAHEVIEALDAAPGNRVFAKLENGSC